MTTVRTFTFGSINVDHIYDCRQVHASQDAYGWFISHQKSEDTLQQLVERTSHAVIAQTCHPKCVGGKGLNQAFAMHRAGCTSRFSGSIGDDGDWIIKRLEEQDFNTDFIMKRKECSTGHVIIQRVQQRENCVLLHPGANSMNTLEQVQVLLTDACPGDLFFVQCETNLVTEALQLASERKLITVLNPSPYPLTCWSNLGQLHWLVINESEAELLLKLNGFEKDCSVQFDVGASHQLVRLRELSTAKHVLVTMGSRGAMALVNPAVCSESCTREFPILDQEHDSNAVTNMVKEHDSIVSIGTEEIKKDSSSSSESSESNSKLILVGVGSCRNVGVVDTTGAGDAFLGYFFSTFYSSDMADIPMINRVVQSLQLANRAAAWAITKVGVVDSIPRRSDLLNDSTHANPSIAFTSIVIA